jgi:MinD-like ATPase involved in chromosome partitioning or flagellar assembly
MMQFSVLLALADSQVEGLLEKALGRGADGLCVAHRCADLEDLLVTAATGVAEAALVSPDLPRLDREALARLLALGVAPVGLAADESGERRLRQLGVVDVQWCDAPAAFIAAAVHEAVARHATSVPGSGFAHALGPAPVPAPPAEPMAAPAGQGRVVAVWGPTGAPGRTTVAIGLAQELALQGWPTLLVDADAYGGSVALSLGLPDEAAGLAAACRQANLGTLDTVVLEALSTEVSPTLAVLTGISRAERWPEVRPAGVEVVLRLARSLAAVTVVDCGFSLEQDEEITYDTLAPRRNGATLAALEQADLVVVVGSADPVGLDRLVAGVAELKECVPGVRTTVVANRVRACAVPGDEGAVREALRRYAGVDRVTCVPLDVAAFDAAVGRGRPLSIDAPPRRAFEQLAASLVGRRR